MPEPVVVRHRGRGPDPALSPRHAGGPGLSPVRGDDRRRRRWSRWPRASRTSSSSTSDCPTWTASTSSDALREWTAVAGHRAVGARSGARQGHRARRRRRRLHDQAVRRRRAARAHPRGAPPRRPERRTRATTLIFTVASCASISRAGTCSSRTSEMHLTPIEYKLLDDAGPARRQGRHPPAAASRGVGAVAHRASPLRCASTWPICGTSSRPSPARPRYLLTEPGVGYRLAAE